MKILCWHTSFIKQLRKFWTFAKRVLFTEKVAVVEHYKTNWKDYYEVLGVSPNAELKVINEAYKQLKHVFYDLSSKQTRESSYFLVKTADIEEAYEVLSDYARRFAYDKVFKAKSHPKEEEAWGQITIEKVEAQGPITIETVFNNQKVSEVQRRKVDRRFRMWEKITRRAVLAMVVLLLLILVGGTTFAFAQPENTFASTFKGMAATLTETCYQAVGLILDIRHVVAGYERNIISKALESMKVAEHLDQIPEVSIPTNDMAYFPSEEHCLFPDYLDRRFSQFKYIIDSNGIVQVDASGVTTDALFNGIK